MTVRKVNVVSVGGDEALDVTGFRHVQTLLRSRLGAYAIGATVYQAFAGQLIWPYGYHHGVEEWLYVIAGETVLREPAGERALTPGKLVCFPSGHLGAHAVAGPGRVVIFSTGDHVEPWLSVYPDSDKVSGPDGIFPRQSAVGYWHREGTGAPVEDDRVVLRREPESTARRPAINALSIPVQAMDPDAPAGFRARTATLGPLLHAQRLGTTVVEMDEREGAESYHYQYGREEWVLVLTGTPTLRHPAGTEELAPGDLVCLPRGSRRRSPPHQPDKRRHAIRALLNPGVAGQHPLSRQRQVAAAQRARRARSDAPRQRAGRPLGRGSLIRREPSCGCRLRGMRTTPRPTPSADELTDDVGRRPTRLEIVDFQQQRSRVRWPLHRVTQAWIRAHSPRLLRGRSAVPERLRRRVLRAALRSGAKARSAPARRLREPDSSDGTHVHARSVCACS